MYDILEDVRVIEASGFLMVPTSAAVLADWGADVIKIEHPVTGDPYRGLRNDAVQPGQQNPMLELPNRGKRSLGLDIKHPDGREILYELIRGADVFVTSFRMPALKKLELDWESLRKVNPRIVYGRGSGYGPRGPDADTPAYDLAATWARAGFVNRLTPPGADEPVQFPGSVGDLSGGINLASGIVAGLYKRERTGVGLEVDVSLYHVGMWIMAQSIGAAPLGLAPRATTDFRQNAKNPLVNSYRTSDDRWVVLCILQPDRHWRDFCEHIDEPGLADDPRFADIDVREQHRHELVMILDRVFSEQDFDWWRRRLSTMQGVWAPALNANEIADDPQVAANDYFAEVHAHDGSTFRSVASPIQFGGEGIGPLHAMPEHAQHTEEILLELGRTWTDITELKQAGVIT